MIPNDTANVYKWYQDIRLARWWISLEFANLALRSWMSLAITIASFRSKAAFVISNAVLKCKLPSPLTPYIYVADMDHLMFRKWHVTSLASSHWLNQWWLLINQIPRNRFQLKCDQGYHFSWIKFPTKITTDLSAFILRRLLTYQGIAVSKAPCNRIWWLYRSTLVEII